MKLRMQSNSIRLRLKRSEVENLADSGSLKETIFVSTDRAGSFQFVLQASDAIASPRAKLAGNRLLVEVPTEAIARWSSSDEVGIEATQSAGSDGELQILIEKDFACLDRPLEENIDTFPNPLAGNKC